MASLRILCELSFPTRTVRLWDGSGGPFVDANGEIWRSAVLTEDALDQVELALNGQAVSIALMLSGLDFDSSNAIWTDYQAGNIVGSKVRIMLQSLNDRQQPTGSPAVRFTGSVDNVIFGEEMAGEDYRSSVSIEIVNRFTLRNKTRGAVFSDVDQRRRAKLLNPSGSADRICERITSLANKTLRWPRFT